MRLIDADALEQKMWMLGVRNAYDRPSFWYGKDKKDYKVIPTKYHNGYDNALADVEKAIQELPTIEERKTEWHPYPQEKPKDLNDKLVTIRESDGDRYTTIGFFDEGQWRGKNEFWIPNNRVTAWAELPKPYEEGAEE